MDLYLIRHGEAYSSEERFERPLNERGKNDVSLIAKHLKDSNIQVENIFHSEKVRAIETAEIIADALNLTNKLAVMTSLDPDNEIFDLIGAVHELHYNTIMVGHLPNIALLSSFLITGNINKSPISFSTATAARFEYQNDIWTLKWSIDPASLRKVDKK